MFTKKTDAYTRVGEELEGGAELGTGDGAINNSTDGIPDEDIKDKKVELKEGDLSVSKSFVKSLADKIQSGERVNASDIK
jgi:hypothetical protein